MDPEDDLVAGVAPGALRASDGTLVVAELPREVLCENATRS
jgi:hypothetical protein